MKKEGKTYDASVRPEDLAVKTNDLSAAKRLGALCESAPDSVLGKASEMLENAILANDGRLVSEVRGMEKPSALDGWEVSEESECGGGTLEFRQRLSAGGTRELQIKHRYDARFSLSLTEGSEWKALLYPPNSYGMMDMENPDPDDVRYYAAHAALASWGAAMAPALRRHDFESYGLRNSLSAVMAERGERKRRRESEEAKRRAFDGGRKDAAELAEKPDERVGVERAFEEGEDAPEFLWKGRGVRCVRKPDGSLSRSASDEGVWRLVFPRELRNPDGTWLVPRGK